MALTVSKTYSNGSALTEAQLDASKTSIETFFNVTKLATANINSNSVTTDKVASTSVSTIKVVDASGTAAKLAESLKARLSLTGSIITYVSTTPPTGHLYCDGSAVSRTTYETLFVAIGTTYGEGDGSTTFNVPDLRGRFLRGVDDGTLEDPDVLDRTAMNTGGNTGDAAGSVQGFATALPSTTYTTSDPGTHTHGLTIPLGTTGSGSSYFGGTVGSGGSTAYDTVTAGAHTHNLNGGGDSETRPVNASVAYHIKT